eukprot:10078063-Prorocentrum_lima.AAC.1
MLAGTGEENPAKGFGQVVRKDDRPIAGKQTCGFASLEEGNKTTTPPAQGDATRGEAVVEEP